MEPFIFKRVICIFHTLKSNISTHFLLSPIHPLYNHYLTLVHIRGYYQQISLRHVTSCNQTSNGGFILQMYGFRSSRIELSWCWVRTFPICCMWQNHRKRPAGRLCAVTRRRFCHQSWRGRWQRLVRHTEDNCSPE